MHPFFAASIETDSEALPSEKTSNRQLQMESRLKELKTACHELESMTSPFHEDDETSDKKREYEKRDLIASEPFFASQGKPTTTKKEIFSATQANQSIVKDQYEKKMLEDRKEPKEKKSSLHETDFSTHSESITSSIYHSIDERKKEVLEVPTETKNPNPIHSQVTKENRMESKIEELKMACNEIDSMTFEFRERDEVSHGSNENKSCDPTVDVMQTDQVLLRDLGIGNSNEPEISDGGKETFNIDETLFRSSSEHKKNVSDLKKKEMQVLNDLKMTCDELTSQFHENDDTSNKNSEYEQRGSKLLETILASQAKFEQQEKMNEEKNKLEIIQTETKMPETKNDSEDLKANLEDTLPNHCTEHSNDSINVKNISADESSLAEARKKVLGDLELDYLNDVGLGYLVDSHIEDAGRSTCAITSDNQNDGSTNPTSIAEVGEGIIKSLGNFGFPFFDK